MEFMIDTGYQVTILATSVFECVLPTPRSGPGCVHADDV